MNPKILLIGKTGQLGGEIFNLAGKFDVNVSAFDRQELDVLNEGQVVSKIKEIRPDILINTSAYHNVAQCEDRPLDAMEINFVAVLRLARLCKKYGVKLVTYSTDYVFDGEKGGLYSEDDSPNPLQVYGISKLAGEYAALNFYPENSFVIRTCGVYGGKTGSRSKKGNFVLNIIKEAKEKKFIQVSSEQVVNPTFSRDLAEATLKLVLGNNSSGLYHLASEGFCSWFEFTKEIFRLIGTGIEVLSVDRGGARGEMRVPKFSALGNTKAKKLGIKLPFWKDGLIAYIDFLGIRKQRLN